MANEYQGWRGAVEPAESAGSGNEYQGWRGAVEPTGASVSAALTGTATASITESDIVTGGKTIILTLTGDTFVTGASSEDGIAAGSDSDQAASGTNWDSLVKGDLDNTNVALSVGNTVATITLPAYAGYDTDALETITWTIPAASLTTLATPLVASPTFTVNRGPDAGLTSSVTVTAADLNIPADSILSFEDGSTHTGANNAATLTDSGAAFGTDTYNTGFNVFNLSDGSSADITDTTATTIVGTLSGGTDNDWDTGDEYRVIVAGIETSADIIYYEPTATRSGDDLSFDWQLYDDSDGTYSVAYTFTSVNGALGVTGTDWNVSVDSEGVPTLTLSTSSTGAGGIIFDDDWDEEVAKRLKTLEDEVFGYGTEADNIGIDYDIDR